MADLLEIIRIERAIRDENFYMDEMVSLAGTLEEILFRARQRRSDGWVI